MKLSQKLTTKAKLNQTLRSWLPILQVASDELKETLEPFIEKNPFVQLEPNPKSRSLNFYSDIYKTSISDTIESSIIYKESLYENKCSSKKNKEENQANLSNCRYFTSLLQK